MKTLYLLSALALVNLFAVSVFATVSGKNIESHPLAQSELVVTPTPITVIKKVIKKVFITPAPKTMAIASGLSVSVGQENNTQAATLPTQNSSLTPPPATPDNRCIITIDGAQYDVTNFRFQHSGGNIFNCGTDMSQIFWSRHNASILSRMQQFRI